MKLLYNLILSTIRDKRIVEYDELIDICKRYGFSKEDVDKILESCNDFNVTTTKVIRLRKEDQQFNIGSKEVLNNIEKLVIYGICEPYIFNLLISLGVISHHGIRFSNILPIVKDACLGYAIFQFKTYSTKTKAKLVNLVCEKFELPSCKFKSRFYRYVAGNYRLGFYGFYKIKEKSSERVAIPDTSIYFKQKSRSLGACKFLYDVFTKVFNTSKILILIRDEENILLLPY